MGSSAPNNINGFYSVDNKIHYFPKGLDKIFTDLTSILIQLGPLKEIHEADLAPFTKLKSISLALNEIEVIEDGLFRHNPELELISLRNNKIFQIYPKVFDNLNNVKYLYMDSNECISMRVTDNRQGVLMAINKITASCSNGKFLNFSEKLDNLKKDSENINVDNLMTFKLSFEDFKAEIESSDLFSYVLNKNTKDFENYLNTSTNWNEVSKNYTILNNLKELGLENVKSDLKVCQKTIVELKKIFLTDEQIEQFQIRVTEDNEMHKQIQDIENSLKVLNDTAFDAIISLQNELSNSFDQKLSEFVNETKIENSQILKKFENSEKCSLNSIDLAFLRIENTNNLMQNNSKAFDERIKAIENDLKFPSMKAFVRSGLAFNKIANFDEITQKINEIQSEMQNGQKSYDKKLKLMEISSKASDAKALKKIDSIDRTVKTVLEDSHEKNENFQTETKKIIRKFENKLSNQEDSMTDSIEKLEQTQNDIQKDLIHTAERIDDLEKALKLNQESLASFRSEVSDIFNKILEKLEGNSENVKQTTSDSILDY